MDVVQLQLLLLVLPGQTLMMDLQLLHLLQDPTGQTHRPVLLSPAHLSLLGDTQRDRSYVTVSKKLLNQMSH